MAARRLVMMLIGQRGWPIVRAIVIAILLTFSSLSCAVADSPDIMGVRLGMRRSELPQQFQGRPFGQSQFIPGAMQIDKCFPGHNPKDDNGLLGTWGDPCIFIFFDSTSDKVAAVLLKGYFLGAFKQLNVAAEPTRKKFGSPTVQKEGKELITSTGPESLSLAWFNSSATNFFQDFSSYEMPAARILQIYNFPCAMPCSQLGDSIYSAAFYYLPYSSIAYSATVDVMMVRPSELLSIKSYVVHGFQQQQEQLRRQELQRPINKY